MSNNELIFRYLSNDLTSEESLLFNEWLESAPENLKKLEEIKEVWEKTRNYPRGFNPNTFKALEKVQETAGIISLRKTLRIHPIVKVAAAALLLVGLLSLLRQAYLNIPGKEVLVTTGANETREVILPDSTHVWLNKKSQLRYPARFARSNRSIKLKGEGYFEVRKNSQSPFSVSLCNSMVKVLGTHFNIQAYDSLSTTTVAVTEGRVQYLVAENPKHSVILTANERVILDNKTLSMSRESITDMNFMAWKTHTFEFHSTPLIDVIKTLSAQYNVEYRITNNSTTGIRIDALFNHKELNEIVKSLSLVTNSNIELRNDTIILK